LVQQSEKGAWQALQRPFSGTFAQALDAVIPKADIDGETGFDTCFDVIRDGTPESFHLKAMSHAGLVNVTQEGRYQRYRADLAVMQALIDYLTAECCADRPEWCVDAGEVSRCCGADSLSSTTP